MSATPVVIPTDFWIGRSTEDADDESFYGWLSIKGYEDKAEIPRSDNDAGFTQHPGVVGWVETDYAETPTYVMLWIWWGEVYRWDMFGEVYEPYDTP